MQYKDLKITVTAICKNVNRKYQVLIVFLKSTCNVPWKESLEKLWEKDWERLGKRLGKIGKDWERLGKIGKDWERLGKIGKDWERDQEKSTTESNFCFCFLIIEHIHDFKGEAGTNPNVFIEDFSETSNATMLGRRQRRSTEKD